MKQIELFPASKIEIDGKLIALAKDEASRALCYEILRNKGMQIGNALWFIIEHNIETDWGVLWDQYELNGYMTYFDFHLGAPRFSCYERDMEVFINSAEIMVWSEDMVFDNKSMQKIKKAIKKYVLDHQYQFGLK